jgi:hypothetical protein
MMYSLAVKPKDGQRMKVQLQAENKKKALLYAKNRWPGAQLSEPVRVK